MQVFFWIGPGSARDNRVYYSSFQLNGVNYTIGDSVYLFPENEHHPHYIGRIVSAFVDEHSGHGDPHCIQVKWFERRVNLEETTRGIEESEREVFELEDVDVNPIGCISGKNYVVRSATYDQAHARMRGADADWYFCRGFFLQSSNSFKPYTDEELAYTPADLAGPGVIEQDSGAAQSQPAAPTTTTRGAVVSPPPPAAAPAPAPTAPSGGGGGNLKRKATGRVCVQCGVTSTPQWREGPTGPKTLCNACGVRYGRAQAKAQKRGGHSTAGSASRQQQQTTSSGVTPPASTKQVLKEEGAGGAVSVKSEPQRPLRQAAQAALARTAAYARTGEFPEEEALLDSTAGGAGGVKLSLDPGTDVLSAQLPIAALDLPLADPGQPLHQGHLGTLAM